MTDSPTRPLDRRAPPRLELGRRFALANFLIGVALVAVLVGVQTRAARRALLARARLGAQVALEQTAALCRVRLAKGQPRELFQDLQPLASLQRFVYLDVYGADGAPVVQLTNPARHRGLTQDISERRTQDDVIDVSQPLEDGGRLLGRLDIGVWAEGIQDDLDRIGRRGWQAGLGLCLLLGVLSWGVGRRLGGRLQRLTAEVRKRDLDDPADLGLSGDDEVAELAAAFEERHRRLRRERARREEAEGHRRDLVNMIVHDMKGPLTVFKTGLPFLREKAADSGDPRAAKMLELLAEGSTRLLRMAEGILNVARVEDPGLPLQRAPLDLAALASARTEPARVSGAAKGVDVSLRPPPALPPLAGDAELLARVLDNLLLNAVEHTPSGGAVVVALSRVADGIRLEVRDTGPGIPAEERTLVFEKFRKGRSLSQGVGLGLAFCKLAVERHGGRIAVEPGDGGRGSVFHFTLPVA